MKLKIMITGGAGFIGMHLAKHLVSEGNKVVILDNFSRAKMDYDLMEFLKLPNVNLVSFDLMRQNLSSEVSMKDVDVIFHFAAIVGVENVVNNPHKVLTENLEMLFNVLDFASKQAKLERFVFASTSEVYAGTLREFGLDFPTPENTALAIPLVSEERFTYALSKIYGEFLCKFSGIPFTILRPHNIYGPRMGMNHLIPQQLWNAHSIEDSSTLGIYSIAHTRTFCYISDMVNMLYLIISSKNCVGKILNIGVQTPEYTVEQVVETCFRILGKRVNLYGIGDTPGSPVRRVPDVSLLNSLISYEPKVLLEEGIKRTSDWYTKHVFSNRRQ